MAKYRDTRLEATGAEFLVLAHLLMEGIEAHKSYVNYPGYDGVAVNAAKKRQCRIQVKSRYYSSDRAFLIKNFDCDYVVYAALNRARSRRDKGDGWPKPPSLYVLPIDLVKAVRRMSHPWGPAVYLNDVEDAGRRYLEKWAPIRKHLGLGRR